MDANNEMTQENETIDLFDLVDDVKENIWWVVAAVVVFTALAALYAYTAKPLYQTESVLREVTDADLIQLNQPRLREALGIEQYVLEDGRVRKVTKDEYITRETAFKSARNVIRSNSTLRLFFDLLVEQDNPELLQLIVADNLSSEQNFLRFAERFNFHDPGAKATDVFLRISFELKNARLAAQVLNDYVRFAISKMEKDTAETVTMIIEGQLNQWNFEAEQLRSQYFSEKNRRMLEVQESADIAAAISQQEPFYSGDRVAIGFEPPLYMMGEKALRAEVRQLNSRKQRGEDDYIVGLPELLWKISEAEKATIQWNKVKYIAVDQKAVVPMQPIKPRKLLVIAIGIVLGGMVGIVAALIAAAACRRAERLQKETATN